ncbi:molecular chaperone DnaK, partial [bacterium]|nr:molecular chaperone DnaK [bacterium]
GTTFSVAAYAEKGRVRVIPTPEGGNLIPSVVAFTDGKAPVVGKVARSQAVANPLGTVLSVKRLMGSDEKIEIGEKSFTPQEISGFILSKVKSDVEEYLDEEVKRAVITVPAYFNDNQRQATIEAGKLAGLDVMRIISEPTAAALAYGLHKENIHHIVVWDLGGGTFDVSILELGDGVFEAKSVNGNTHLGGDDWDRRIVEYMMGKFTNRHGIDLNENRTACQRLKEAAEKAKKELSVKRYTNIRIPFIVSGVNLGMSLNREKFEDITQDLLEMMITPTRQALSDAKLSIDDIDQIVLVGGSTRMPAVQELARRIFNKEPYKNLNPDEVVALGAAIQSGILTGEVRDVALVDVTPLSLGIEVQGSIFTKIIERNTAIPTSAGQIFTTAEDNQTQVDIHILQGERALAADNISLGEFTLKDIPFAQKGEPQIEVTFHIDSNGVLKVTAQDLYTENEDSVVLTSPKRMTEEQIRKIVKEAKAYSIKDKEHKKEIQTKIRAENMILAARLVMEEGKEVLAYSECDMVEKIIFELKSALTQGDIEGIRLKTEELRMLNKSIYNSAKSRIMT